jgi:hypothetical protein
VAPELLKVMPIRKFNANYLTVETLRKEGFEDLTDEELQAFCDFTKSYADILVDSYLEKQTENYESSTKRVSKIRKN